MNSENISFLFSLQKGRIRRSLDNKPPEINYFNNILNDDVLKLIFEYLPINDLLSAMSTCKRFYKIGYELLFSFNYELIFQNGFIALDKTGYFRHYYQSVWFASNSRAKNADYAIV